MKTLKNFGSVFFNKGELGLFVSKLAILGDMYAIEFVNWMNED